MNKKTKQQKRIALAAMTTLSAALVTACGVPNQSTLAPTTTNAQPSITTGNASTSTGFPITLTDDLGAKVTVRNKPMHIVSGTEGTDEMIASLVPKSRIALVTNLSSDPTYSDTTALVKGIRQWSGEDPEQALAVHPDLVLMASYAPQKVVTQLRNAGVPVYEFSDFNSISSIEHNIEVIGKLVGATPKATALVKQMNANLKRIQKAVAGDKKPKVLDYSSYGFAGGNGTTVNDMIRDAGGINAAAKLNGWAKITDEEIVKMNPDVIIDSTDDKAFLTKLEKEPGLQDVTAIKEHHVYAISSADLSSVSQYVVKGVYDVAKVLHPSAHLKGIRITP